MKNKSALVIVYSGNVPSHEEQRKLVEYFAKNSSYITSTEDIDIYGLDAHEIARGILIKATSQAEEIVNEVDAAAIFIGEHFKDSISAGIPTFAANISTVYVSIKLRGMYNITENETKLIKSVEILAQENAFNAISTRIRNKYHITLAIVNVIRNIYDSICQGQIIG